MDSSKQDKEEGDLQGLDDEERPPSEEQLQQEEPDGGGDIADLLGLENDGGDHVKRKQRQQKQDEASEGPLISFDDDGDTYEPEKTSPKVHHKKQQSSKPSRGYGSTGYGSTGYGSTGYGSTGIESTGGTQKKTSVDELFGDWSTEDWGEDWNSPGGGANTKEPTSPDGWDNEEWLSEGWSSIDLKAKSN